MDVRVILFGVIVSCFVALSTINFYLISLVRKLEKENERLQPPFQGVLGVPPCSTKDIIKFKINVLRPLYNEVMRKKMKPLGKRNQARAKAESKALFESMLRVGKHTIITPENRKGTRASNKAKAIRESL